ncbi:transcriptional regulator with XRE-family HTH domain [Paraburkholderia bannensis]|uniref:Transcriptional regulator with XRE-family HTH domain n=1 Tax=Paraburkholderia bannensis TaxID=765414 RepID=A0A7W9TU49_9BURK|nr:MULTISPECIES: helix-turn-helix domain-containing protein [Paraburkholderia]MBB3256109.1 transcriptional regulator with XRE-family HTH domain [Paraburkholderia sp. WP4_3_2]MBB6101109.1 transcriptional regulator with XRE-family HTH domain [Paraburkholderia bannensis]
MNEKDEEFFIELGKRIAGARRACGMTQQDLADMLGIAQQTLAHYEVGRSRIPASLLPALTERLLISFEELLCRPAARSAGKASPLSRLQRQLNAIEQLPRTKQHFVSEMLDTILAQRVK